MNPQVLYEMYLAELESEGVGDIGFDDLPAAEQIAWGKLCRRLQREHGLV